MLTGNLSIATPWRNHDSRTHSEGRSDDVTPQRSAAAFAAACASARLDGTSLRQGTSRRSISSVEPRAEPGTAGRGDARLLSTLKNGLTSTPRDAQQFRRQAARRHCGWRAAGAENRCPGGCPPRQHLADRLDVWWPNYSGRTPFVTLILLRPGGHHATPPNGA